MIAFLSNWLLLYPIAFSLFVVLRLSEATTDGRRVSVGVHVIRSMIFILFAFAFLAVGCRTTLLSLLWAILFGIMAGLLLLRHARLNRSTVTMTILSCRDLPQMQRAAAYFSDEQGGFLGRRLHRFRQLLAQGVPWSSALEVTGFCKGSYERLAARLADRFGVSRNTSQDLNAPLRIEIEFERLLSRMSILVWIVLFGPIFVFYRLVILPTLLKMLAEFDLQVPATLAMVQNDYSISWLSSVAAAVVLLLFGTAFLLWLFPRLTLHLPFRWLCDAYYRCLGFVALARVAEHTPDLVDACRQTSELVPAPHIATQFRVAVAGLERGQSPADAFATARLIRGNRLGDFAAILDTAGIAWATQQLATAEVERMLYRYSLVIQFLVVFLTLCFAVLVGVIAVGMFQALIAMILSLN